MMALSDWLTVIAAIPVGTPSVSSTHRVDALGHQAGFQLRAERVAAHAADQADLRTQARRRHRLVGPLAAGMRGKTVAGQGLAELRHHRGGHHQVHVDAAHHQYPSYRGLRTAFDIHCRLPRSIQAENPTCPLNRMLGTAQVTAS